MGIVFFGNERLATGVKTKAPTLQALIEAGYEVSAVVSNYEPAKSRTARPLEIQEVAERHNIPVLLPAKLDQEFLETLKGYSADIGVLIAYGKIVPQSVIDVFPKGIVNIHPSLLPLHRGPTPLESVILDGSQKTGVSLMQLAQEMDAGPVYGQSEFELNGTETKQTLADNLLEIGKSMVIELLPSILDGSVVALPQDSSRATYDKLITKADGLVDWTKPAKQIDREVRAFIEWPKSRTNLAGKEVTITAARLGEQRTENGEQKSGEVFVNDQKELVVKTSEGELIIEKLKPAGKNEMTAEAFIAGYKGLL